jgi:tetratricopeptide (TPR) repeat protein
MPVSGKGWLLAAIAFAFLLALLWSIDASLRYLCLGGMVVSIYFYVRSLPKPPTAHTTAQRNSSPTQPSVINDLREIFTDKKVPVPEAVQERRGKLLVFMVLGFIFSIFLTILLSILFADPYEESADYLYQKATDFFNAQQYDSASYYYGQVIARDPQNATARLERGNAFYNLNRNDSALVMYRQALELNPTLADAQYNIGLIEYNQRSFRKSIETAKGIFAYNADYQDALLLIGDCFYAQNELDSAMRYYEDAYNRGYRSPGLSHVMGYIYDTKGNTGQAIAQYKEALGMDSTRTDIYRRLGELLPGSEGEWFRNRYANAPQ